MWHGMCGSCCCPGSCEVTLRIILKTLQDSSLRLSALHVSVRAESAPAGERKDLANTALHVRATRKTHPVFSRKRMQASADTDEALRAALAAGNAHVKEHRWAGGWLVRTRQAPIVKSSEISMSDYSHGAWKRELGLTNVAGQSLPGYLFGGNALELVHEASGVRISFCALEALRSWVLEESAPVRHLSPLASPPEWDYTFTTAYPGSTTVAPVGTQPDRTSFHSRPAVDLASGQVRTPCTRPNAGLARTLASAWRQAPRPSPSQPPTSLE